MAASAPRTTLAGNVSHGKSFASKAGSPHAVTVLLHLPAKLACVILHPSRLVDVTRRQGFA
jgi:hypothetical protein